jgi:hypothetical protein
MEIFISKLVVLLTVRRNLCIRAGHYVTCKADTSFYGRCNYGICTHMKILSINKYKISDEKTCSVYYSTNS